MSQGTFHIYISESPSHTPPSTQFYCYQHGVPIEHEARQVTKQDFHTFTYILASDDANLRNLERIRPAGSKAIVKLWGSYVDGKAIPDPYYGGLVSTSAHVTLCEHLLIVHGMIW